MKLNKKGYMLIEIILASAIAFGVGYFILQMVINLKNKNDDLLVETLTTTDQTIIMNKLMQYAKSEEVDFSCDNLKKDGNIIKYGDEVIDIVNDYATVGDISCDYTDELLRISVPLNVKQLSNKNFDVKLDYNPNAGNIGGYTKTIATCKQVLRYQCSKDAIKETHTQKYSNESACINACGNACYSQTSGNIKYFYCDFPATYSCYSIGGQLYNQYCIKYNQVSCDYGWHEDSVSNIYEFEYSEGASNTCSVEDGFTCNADTVDRSYVSACN